MKWIHNYATAAFFLLTTTFVPFLQVSAQTQDGLTCDAAVDIQGFQPRFMPYNDYFEDNISLLAEAPYLSVPTFGRWYYYVHSQYPAMMNLYTSDPNLKLNIFKSQPTVCAGLTEFDSVFELHDQEYIQLDGGEELMFFVSTDSGSAEFNLQFTHIEATNTACYTAEPVALQYGASKGELKLMLQNILWNGYGDMQESTCHPPNQSSKQRLYYEFQAMGSDIEVKMNECDAVAAGTQCFISVTERDSILGCDPDASCVAGVTISSEADLGKATTFSTTDGVYYVLEVAIVDDAGLTESEGGLFEIELNDYVVVPASSLSAAPSDSPSAAPSAVPSHKPSETPSATPSHTPSVSPSHTPSVQPSLSPSTSPSTMPSNSPSSSPSSSPSASPSATPLAAASCATSVEQGAKTYCIEKITQVLYYCSSVDFVSSGTGTVVGCASTWTLVGGGPQQLDYIAISADGAELRGVSVGDEILYLHVNNGVATGTWQQTHITPSYLGCYKDTAVRALTLLRGPDYTRARCEKACTDEGYYYYAMQAQSWCSCGHSTDQYDKWGKADDEAECGYQCFDGDGSFCGGSWRNSLWRTGLAA